MWRRTLIGSGIALLLTAPAVAGSGYLGALERPEGLSFVGSETCLDCHDDVGAFYANSPHAVERNLVVPGTAVGSCEHQPRHSLGRRSP